MCIAAMCDNAPEIIGAAQGGAGKYHQHLKHHLLVLSAVTM